MFGERVHGRSLLGDRLVEVQDQLRHRGVGRQLARDRAADRGVDSPALDQCRGRRGIAPEAGQLVVEARRAGWPAPRAAAGGPWRAGRPRRSALGRSSRPRVMHPLGEGRGRPRRRSRRSAREGLERRVGPRLADDAGLAAGGVEGDHRRRRRPSASRRCRGCGDRGSGRGPGRSRRRPARSRARPADTASPTGRRAARRAAR